MNTDLVRRHTDGSQLLTQPQAIKGRSVGVEINNWPNAKAPAGTIGPE
jgi:hypothetical protein